MASGFQPLKLFISQPGENNVQVWEDWKDQFNLYLIAAEKTGIGDEAKIGMLKNAMGPECITQVISEAQTAI